MEGGRNMVEYLTGFIIGLMAVAITVGLFLLIISYPLIIIVPLSIATITMVGLFIKEVWKS
jgi:hypothetical protein